MAGSRTAAISLCMRLPLRPLQSPCRVRASRKAPLAREAVRRIDEIFAIERGICAGRLLPVDPVDYCLERISSTGIGQQVLPQALRFSL